MRQPTSLQIGFRAPGRMLGVFVSLVALLVLTSCDDRAPVDDWEAIWRSTVWVVEEGSRADIPHQRCEDILAFLRVQRTVLSPVPREDLDTPVDGWFSEAERIFFECDLDGGDADGSLSTLRTLESEVEVVLESAG